MKYLNLLHRIPSIIGRLFADQSGKDIAAMRDHFEVAYDEAQMAALVAVGMILRVFKLTPEPAEGSRDIITIVGLLIQFLQHFDRFDVRGGPNPLDAMVEQGLSRLERGE